MIINMNQRIINNSIHKLNTRSSSTRVIISTSSIILIHEAAISILNNAQLTSFRSASLDSITSHFPIIRPHYQFKLHEIPIDYNERDPSVRKLLEIFQGLAQIVRHFRTKVASFILVFLST